MAQVLAESAMKGQATGLRFFLEVFILKDVGSSTDKAKAHSFLAGFAIRETFSADHHDLVGITVVAVVNNFVDAGLSHRVP